MPSTPTPRSKSSDQIRVGPCAAVRFSALDSCAPGGAFVADNQLITRQSLPRDTQTMQLQHPLDVLPASLIADPLPSIGCVEDNTEGAIGRERAAQVLVEAALVVRNDQ